jgi:aminotransferase
MINIFQPSVGEEEAAAVAEVFAGNWLGHGPRTRVFETEFAGHLGVDPETVVFVNSGTAGLFLAVLALRLGRGDDVVLPSISFVGAANAVVTAGARPVFCDVDPVTLNPSAVDVERALTPRTAAVVLLHYGGLPGDVEAIARLCRERGVALVEDAACAVASSVGGRACGTFGDLAMWSFDAMKILVTGDGGMVRARDPEHAAAVRRLAYHGLARASGFSSSTSSPAAVAAQRWWEIDVREPGQRLVGNDVTAAVGSVQLRRLPGFVARRREIARTYDALLGGVDGIGLPPAAPADHVSSHYFYWVRLHPRIRDDVAADLLAQGVYTTFRYPPLHRVPVYGTDHPPLPGTDRAAAATLLLPLHQGLSDDDVRTVGHALVAAVRSRPASPLRAAPSTPPGGAS